VTKVYARKGGRNNFQALYVDDGVYGSFNNVVYDHALPLPKRVQSLAEYQRNLRSGGAIVSDENNNLIPTAVFGPTCDGLDQMCSLENTLLERCSIGDWLIWENQGAYTHTASYVFNGYTHIPSKIYCTL
jgi:diaminopimelate decarboxylase